MRRAPFCFRVASGRLRSAWLAPPMANAPTGSAAGRGVFSKAAARASAPEINLDLPATRGRLPLGQSGMTITIKRLDGPTDQN